MSSCVVAGDAGVAAEGGDELVTRAWLRGWDAALVEPGLEIGLRPVLVQPVAWVQRGLADLVGDGLVVGAGGLKERIASARGWVGDAVVVQEGLELRLSPAVRC